MKRLLCALLTVGCATLPEPSTQAPPRPVLGSRLTVARVDISGRGYELPAALAGPTPDYRHAPVTGRRALGLAEALRLARAQSIDRALARARAEIAEGRLRASRGTLFPELEAGAQASHRDGAVQGSFGDFRDVEFSTYESTVAAVYRRNFVADLVRTSASVYEREATELEFRDSEQQLFLRVSELYYALSLAKVGTEIAEALERDSSRLAAIVQAREQAGVASGSDSARATARRLAASQDAIEARRMRDEASARLAVVLRISPSVRLDPAERELGPARFVADSGWDGTTAARRRPAVRALERRARAAERAYSGAVWDLIAPQLVAELRRTWVGDRPNDLAGRTSYGALLLWTISEEKLGRASEASARQKAAKLTLEQAADQASGEALVARDAITAAAERVPLASAQLEAAERAWRITLARLRDGTGTALEVFETQDDVARARLGLARAIVSFNLSQLRLLAATGSLTPARLVYP